MIYHDMLGVRENATASEIDCAYEKKCSALENGDVKLTQEQLIRKRQELEKAKAACLDWQSMSAGERSSRRVQQYVSEIGDPARTNAICFGPFTFFNLLFCSCCNDSAICNSGGCSLTTLAAICDLAFYGFLAASLWKDKKETEEKEAREEEERAREKYLADRRRELEDLRKQAQECETQYRQMQQKCHQTSIKLEQTRRIITFFTAIGSTDSFGLLSQQIQEQLEQEEQSVEELRKKYNDLRNRVRDLSSVIG